MQKRWTVMLLWLLAIGAGADGLDDIRQTLEHAGQARVQEKVYVHTDNQCYFVGDTLWYKAYVVRADNLQPTDLSRVLYVELLSPDGLLVERQHIVVNPRGYTCGQFVLTDSLYSGYYELRAYTRWMLNFNMRHHRYRNQETWWFYNKQMAADYFRLWDGLYSRVLPVYSKPRQPGDYDARYMYQRPKQRVAKAKKDNLVVNFYPEGGHLIAGVENRVAFSVVDQYGECIQIKGQVRADGAVPIDIQTEHMGRGTFLVTPTMKRMKAHFTFRGKDYDVDLPEAESQGVALRLDGDRLLLQTVGLPQDREYGLSILCRGTLRHFEPLSLGTPQLSLNTSHFSLPTGVNDVTIFDSDGRIWADRLFFVNNHDQDSLLITSPIIANHSYSPYERVEVPIRCEGVTEPTNISIAIRDTNTDEPTYDSGDIMTDLLLSSELKGFVANPAYYFETDDEQHRHHLDLLMMVQGWRRYKWNELADAHLRLQYAPEVGLTVEGTVYNTPNLIPIEPEEIVSWSSNLGFSGYVDENGNPELVPLNETNSHVGINHGVTKQEVMVEAEIIVGQDIAASTQKTRGGRFLFQVPGYYGDGILNIKAYSEGDSVKKNMLSRQDKDTFNEDAFPDYYVKRDLFYPSFTRDYDYYENHQPDYDAEMLIDTLSELSMENDVHQLGNVNVKGHRRGKRAIDWTKPAFVMDAYDLYNELTDRGLSWGKLDMRQFPVQVCKLLYGNMNRYKMYNVDGRIDRYTYYRNYQPDENDADKQWNNRNARSMYNVLKLKRLQDVRVYSDYEPRKEDSTMVYDSYHADATVELVPIPNDGMRPSYRDRHIILHGFNEPEAFYQPDYSSCQPAEPADYRRTLYWNPNAVTDSEGRFTAVFYNNSKETRVRLSAAGVTASGCLLRSK